MILPKFCFEKAFWIVLAVFCTLLFSIVSYEQTINAQQSAKINENTALLLSRSSAIQKSEITYDNVLIICEKLNTSCFRFTP